MYLFGTSFERRRWELRCTVILQLLDFLLGEGHEALFRRAELKTLVDLHGNEVTYDINPFFDPRLLFKFHYTDKLLISMPA